tara:strand:+ start:840 stop:1511 length:672 start_codon:yes stop_codon:yes gene_type:complete
MSYEYECKIINMPISNLRNKIIENNGKKIHSSLLFRRYLFFLPGKRQNGFIRLRNEGNNKITLTCKIFTSNSKYPRESEIELHCKFEEAHQFLLDCGLKQKSYIETKREKWSHPLVKEIVIDNWPGLDPYMEIDCENENNLKKVLNIFKFDKKNIYYEGVDKLYLQKYGITKNKFINLPVLDFNDTHKQIGFKRLKKQYKNKKTRKNNGRNKIYSKSSKRTRK